MQRIVRHEVAIYSASAGWGGFYDRSAGWDGGAERQMTLLARSLAERDVRVAHIIFPPREPIDPPYPVTLIHRAQRRDGILGWTGELVATLRAFASADAQILVIRSGSAALAVGALFCKLRGRILIFSSSNISDFTLETMSLPSRLFFRLGLRFAAAVVVQSEDQRTLAVRSFPWLRRVVHIPSFVEQVDEPSTGAIETPEAFLWFGRCAVSKHPIRYVELARTMPEARFRMVVTWNTDGLGLRDELDRAAADVPNLELIEPVVHARLLDLIRRSVAVVNTSTLEGMPNSFLEAWSCGVPVLTFEFDPDGIVARQRLGVSASGSRDRFVQGAQELWRSRLERNETSQRVRSYVEETHSMENVAARWNELFAELRSGNR